MKITAHFSAYVSGKSPVTLCDNAAGDYVTGFKMSSDGLTEENPLPRAVELGFFDRGNIRHNLSFSTNRVHASEVESFAFAVPHGQDVQGIADIEIETETEAGGSVTRWLREAVIRPVECVEVDTATSIFNYTIRGGKFYDTQT